MKLFFLSLLRRIGTDNISFLAGGVAFYGLLALFPAMGALVSLFGLAASPRFVRAELERVADLFPPDVYAILSEQLAVLVQQSSATLSLTVAISLFITLFSATRGTKAMLAALNLVFRVNETRKWWFRQILSFLLTLGGLVMLMLAIFLVVAIPVMLKFLPGDFVALIKKPLDWMRWAILSGAVFGGIIIVFIFGPSRPVRQQRLSAVMLGAAVATALWIGGALGVSWVVQKVPQLHAAYGSLSAVVALMLWMMISAYAVLAGAAVTATLDKSSASSAEDRD